MLSVFLAAAFAVLVGAAFCFLGYRLFLVMLPIWGFFAGFWMGAQGVVFLFGDGFLATTTGWVIGFILGLVCALFSYLFYYLGVTIVAAGFGSALGSGLMAWLGFDPGWLTAIVAIACAIIVAVLVLVLNLQKVVIIGITAIGGSNAIVLGSLLLLGHVALEDVSSAGSAIQPVLQESWLWIIFWAVLAIAGFVVQIRSNRTFAFSKQDYRVGWG